MKAKNLLFGLALVLAAGILVFYVSERAEKKLIVPNSRLLQAIKRFDAKEVQTLLAKGEDPNQVVGLNANTCLATATESLCMMNAEAALGVSRDPSKEESLRKIISSMLDAGADPNMQFYVDGGGIYRESAMSIAVGHRNADLVDEFLRHGANPKQLKRDGATLLMVSQLWPSYGKDAEMVKKLVDAGMDVRTTDRYGRNALHHAAGLYYIGELDDLRSWVKALIDAGVDINGKDVLGMRPFDCARTTETADMLKSMGARSGVQISRDR